MSNLNYILWAAMLLCGAGKAFSQHAPAAKPDSLATDSLQAQAVRDTVNAESEHSAEDTYFNALEYSMQKRYRMRRYSFRKGSIWSHAYVSLYGGMEQFPTRENRVDMCVNNLGGLSVGTEFTAVHSARLTLQAGFGNSRSLPSKYKRFGIETAYLFNLSAYVWGYNPYRLFEFSPLLGLSLTRSKGPQQTHSAAGLFGGLQVKLHGYKNIDFFVEPAVTVYSDGIDHYTSGNWHGYDLAYRVNLGAIYRFADPLRHEPHRTDEGKILKDVFVSAAGGLQYQYSDKTKKMGLLTSSRPHMQLSVGKWLRPYLGLRASVFYGTNVWRDNTQSAWEKGLVGKQKDKYLGGRGEVMVNAFGFAADKAWANRFWASALAGIELGGMSKQDTYLKKRVYAALTGGLQVGVNITRHWGVFIEPRYSWIPYSFLPKNAEGAYMERIHYSDNIFSWNAGLAYRF